MHAADWGGAPRELRGVGDQLALGYSALAAARESLALWRAGAGMPRWRTIAALLLDASNETLETDSQRFLRLLQTEVRWLCAHPQARVPLRSRPLLLAPAQLGVPYARMSAG